MILSSEKPETTSWWRDHCANLCLIALAVFLGHYLRTLSLGLYEDDYWAIAPNFNAPLSQLPDTFLQCFRYWPTGRPLNHFLPVALSAIGYKLGGLPGIYALAGAWLTLNATLVFAIARRLLSPSTALLASFVYILCPADATKILLVHAAHVQGSMTFLLCGLYLWLRGGVGRWISYPVATMSLLSYESAFLPFLAVPLLWSGNRKATLRTWLTHIVLCIAIVTLLAIIRLKTGDVRADSAITDLGTTTHRLLTSLYLGPFTSIRMLGKGAWLGLQHASPAGIGAAIFLASAVFACRSLRHALPVTQTSPSLALWPNWLARHRTAEGQLPWWWVLATALLMLSGSYALTLTNYPPTQESGRLTSTHVAAAWGLALAVAALAEGGRRHLGKTARWFAPLLAVWIGTLLLYQDFVQREYVRSWDIQRGFWRQVAALAPEAGPGWTIIVTGSTAEQSSVIASNSWADFHVCRQLFNSDPAANTPAFAHLGVLGHLVDFQTNGDGFLWKPRFWGGPTEPIDRTHLVLLNSERGILHRIPFIDTVAGRLESAALLPTGPRVSWPDTPLARLYFPESNTAP